MRRLYASATAGTRRRTCLLPVHRKSCNQLLGVTEPPPGAPPRGWQPAGRWDRTQGLRPPLRGRPGPSGRMRRHVVGSILQGLQEELFILQEVSVLKGRVGRAVTPRLPPVGKTLAQRTERKVDSWVLAEPALARGLSPLTPWLCPALGSSRGHGRRAGTGVGPGLSPAEATH